MSDLISRSALLEKMKQTSRYFDVKFDIEEAPAVDAVPVVHGRWVKDGDFLICLNCESEINIKNSLGVENRKNFCPNCGATMDGERITDDGIAD